MMQSGKIVFMNIVTKTPLCTLYHSKSSFTRQHTVVGDVPVMAPHLINCIIMPRHFWTAFRSPSFSKVRAASSNIDAVWLAVDRWRGRWRHAISRAVACSLSAKSSPSQLSGISKITSKRHRILQISIISHIPKWSSSIPVPISRTETLIHLVLEGTFRGSFKTFFLQPKAHLADLPANAVWCVSCAGFGQTAEEFSLDWHPPSVAQWPHVEKPRKS